MRTSLMRTSVMSARAMPSAATLIAFATFSALAAAGCSGEDVKSAEEQLVELGVTDPPETLLAIAVLRPRESLVLGGDLASSFVRVQYAVKGYSWTDAACAADRVVALIGSTEVEAISLGELQTIERTNPDAGPRARECASPESIARIDAPIPEGATSAVSAAPDIDPTAVSAMFADLYRATSEQAGFSEPERRCVVEKLVTARAPDDFVKIVTGRQVARPEESAEPVNSCLSEARRQALAPRIAKAVLADKAAAKKEHDAKQAELDARIDEFNKTSTTVPE